MRTPNDEPSGQGARCPIGARTRRCYAERGAGPVRVVPGCAPRQAMLQLAAVTDVHFGRRTRFEGRLRKLADLAPELTRQLAVELQGRRPRLVVNLGDVIEDETAALDRQRYAEALGILEHALGHERLVSIAGNHDSVNLGLADLRELWGMPGPGPLYRSWELEGMHFVALHTQEHKDTDISLDAEQLRWLRADLAANRLPTVVLMHHSAADQDLRGNRWFERSGHIALVREPERRELRALLREHGRTVLVLNGHLHWNHLFVDDGIPYVTLQSLTENIQEDEPGEPAGAWAWVELDPSGLRIEVAGRQPARYQVGWQTPRW